MPLSGLPVIGDAGVTTLVAAFFRELCFPVKAYCSTPPDQHMHTFSGPHPIILNSRIAVSVGRTPAGKFCLSGEQKEEILAALMPALRRFEAECGVGISRWGSVSRPNTPKDASILRATWSTRFRVPLIALQRSQRNLDHHCLCLPAELRRGPVCSDAIENPTGAAGRS